MQRPTFRRRSGLSICTGTTGLLGVLSIAVLAALVACDAGGPVDTDGRIPPSSRPDDTASAAAAPESVDGPRTGRGLAGVRARADAAFAALEPGSAARTTSRIGPQSWPGDLPPAFPRPEGAHLLADTRRDGDRLLLIDLPTPVDRAADALDRALRERGYAVDRAETRRVRHALLARDDTDEAVLTFLARDGHTRLEILFLDRAEG